MKKIAWIGIVCAVLGTVSAFSGDSHIVADPTAPGQRPTVIGTAGGLPQVNINTPNNNGLSYNRYQQFDVGQQGAILNNATQHVQTQLGGWIDANPNLIGGAARLIVNEVNSPNPSHIGGFVEIAGHRADVVIANPSGINVAGGGFINANRATLTTGVPQIENGVLTGYNVRGGQINVMGGGLDFKDASYADIIARSVHVNAGVWANNLNVIGGDNFVSRDGSQVTRLNPDVETGISVDVGALGGMYANQIRLVGTGRGVGVNSDVRNAGEIVARVGEVTIDADGNLVSSGFISGQSGVQANVGGSFVNDEGWLQSGGDVAVNAGADIQNSGTVISYGETSFNAGAGFDSSGDIESHGGMTIVSGTGDIVNTGSMKTGGSLSFTVEEDFTNSGSLESSGDMTVLSRTGGFENTQTGKVLAGGALEVRAYESFSNDGSMQSQKGVIGISQTGSLSVDGEILTNGGMTLSSRNDFENTGRLSAAGDMSMSTEGNFANSGSVGAGGSMDVLAKGSFDNSGGMQSLGEMVINAETGALTNSGKIASNQWIGLTSQGDMENALTGSILAGGDLTLTTEGGFASAGEIEAVGKLTVDAYADFANSGSMLSGGELKVTARTGAFSNSNYIGSNSDMILASALDWLNTGELWADSLTITAGGDFTTKKLVVAARDLFVTAQGKVVNSGDVKVGNNVTAEAVTGLFGNNGTIAANGDAVFLSARDMENQGLMSFLGNVTATAGGSFINKDEFVSGGAVKIGAAKNFVNSGGLESVGDLTITAETGYFNNTALLATGADATFSSKDDMVNNLGRMLAGGNMTAETEGAWLNSGEMTVIGDLAMLATGGIRNLGEIQGGNVSIVGASFDNTGLVDGGEVVIKAETFIRNVDTGSIFGDHIALQAEDILNGSSVDTGHAPISSMYYNPETKEYEVVGGLSPAVDGSDDFDFTEVDADKTAEFGEDEDYDEWIPEEDEDESTGGEIVESEDMNRDTSEDKDYTYEPETGTGTTGSSGLIAARDRLDIAFAGTMTNREDGLIYSGGDMYVGGALDADNRAIGTGGVLKNSSAVIDVDRNLVASVKELINYNAHYEVEKRLVSSGRYTGYRFSRRGDPKIYIVGIDNIQYGKTKRGASKITVPYDEEDYFQYDFTRSIYDHFVIDSKPGFITAGGDITIIGDATNDRSNLVAGGKLEITGNFDNIAAMETQIIDDYGSIYWSYVKSSGTFGNKHKRKNSYAGIYDPADVLEFYEKDVNIFGSPTISAPEDKQATDLSVTGGSAVDASVTLTTNVLVSIGSNAMLNLSGLNSNLYTVNRPSTSNYLIETNPRLTNYRDWLSSDFMLSRLASDPQNMLKRLGDGYYEQRLVRDQLIDMTGARFLNGFDSDEEQYQSLMLSGVEFAEAFNLEIGVQLTAEQMQHLTSDIVWLEYVTVDTPEGPVQALAPVVYLAPGREILLAAGGGIASGREVDIKGELNNAGNIFGADRVSVHGNNVNNSGYIAGEYVSLAAIRDINNRGGTIVGQTGVELKAGRDINIESTTYSTSSQDGNQSSNRTDLASQAVVMVTDRTSTLSMQAGNNINLKAAVVDTEGAMDIAAGNDLNIGGVAISFDHVTGEKGRNYLNDRVSMDVGSSLYAANEMNLSAGNDIAVVGSNVIGDSKIDIKAGGSVSVTDGRAQEFHETTSYEKSRGFLSSKTQKTHEIMNDNYAIGSEISGATINIDAGQDFALRGSTVAAENGLVITAGGNIDILGADNYSDHFMESETKRSGFSASFSGASVGVSYGKTKKEDESRDREHTITGSLVGSIDGNVNLYAGNDINIAGSHVVAGTGDISMSGENVNIVNQYETHEHSERHKFEQSGISLSIGLGGPAGKAIESSMQALDTLDRAQNASTGRAQALYGIAAARQGYDAVRQIGNVDPSQGVSGNVGIGINLGFSSSKSESSFESHEQVAVGSTIMSGGSTTIVARGRENVDNTGDITIVGSQVTAGGKVILDAKNDINLLSAEEQSGYTSSDSNSSSGFGVGFNVGTNGFGWSVNGHHSQGQGSGSGSGTTHAETVIVGYEGVDFTSGNDTTLKGAQIIGDKVVGNVGGDLTIISEQDTYTEHVDRSSSGFGISVGTGSFGGSFNTQKQKGDSDYASVDEQSGIFAGEGGFDITVGGHTGLTGAVIASEANPEDNRLVTGSISTEDIYNHSEYEASTSGFGGEFSYVHNPKVDDKEANTGSLSPSLPMNDGGDDSSVTKSAIAEGSITITNEEQQVAKTGQTAEEAVEALNRDTENAHDGALERAPSLDELLNRQAELAEAAALAGKAIATSVGDISEMMLAKTGDDGWREGGAYKILLQGAAAALIAELGNGEAFNAALGAMASQLASKNINEFAQELASHLGGDPDAQKLVANLLSNIFSDVIGIAAGGESGGNLASLMNRHNQQIHPDQIQWLTEHSSELLAKLKMMYPEIPWTLDSVTSLATMISLGYLDATWAGQFDLPTTYGALGSSSFYSDPNYHDWFKTAVEWVTTAKNPNGSLVFFASPSNYYDASVGLEHLTYNLKIDKLGIDGRMALGEFVDFYLKYAASQIVKDDIPSITVAPGSSGTKYVHDWYNYVDGILYPDDRLSWTNSDLTFIEYYDRFGELRGGQDTGIIKEDMAFNVLLGLGSDAAARYVGKGFVILGGKVLSSGRVATTTTIGKGASVSKIIDDVGVGGYDLAKVASYKLPNAKRHVAEAVTSKSWNKGTTSIVSKNIDMSADIALIRAGKAVKTGELYQINGRIYGTHNGTWIPVSGEGVIQLERNAYKGYAILNEMGGPTPEAIRQMTQSEVSKASQEAAIKAWNIINKK